MTEADVFEFFSRAGKVRDVQLVMERRSTRHKGSGYVEFYSQDSVKRAVALAGGSIHGFPVAVKPSSDENAVVGNGMDMGLNGAMPVPGPPPPSLHSAGAPSGQVPMAAVGWSMTARQPVPQIPSAAESKLSAERGGNGTSSAPTALVSVQELAVLLNPNNLPVPPAPQGSLAAMEQVPLPLVANKAAGAAQPGASFFTRLYIGSVPFQLGEDDLRNIFKPFGAITSLQLQRDASTGRSRGYGFVEYADHSSAKKALAIDGLDVAGRPLKVALASHDSRAPILPRATALAPAAPAIQGSQLREVTGELDEGREGGVSMSASQKASLRERLSRGESMVSGPDGALPTAQIPSKSLLLGNMFDPSSEAAGFEQELAEDVRDECASKYGTVTHLFVDKSSRGLVYIRFASIAIAGKALLSLNGRWFGGKRISAAYVSDVEYKKRFTDAPV